MTRKERRRLQFGPPTGNPAPKPAPAGATLRPRDGWWGPSAGALLPGETVLDDDYPVFWEYLYIADGQLLKSPIQGTVRDLKRAERIDEVRRCELIERMTRAQSQA